MESHLNSRFSRFSSCLRRVCSCFCWMHVLCLKKVQNMDFDRRGSARIIVHYKTVSTLLIRKFASQKVWAIPYCHKISMECYCASLAALTPKWIESFWSVCSSVFLKLAVKTVLLFGKYQSANKASVFQKPSHCQNTSFKVLCTSVLCYPWKRTTIDTAMPLRSRFPSNSQFEKCEALMGSVISFCVCLHVEWSCR